MNKLVLVEKMTIHSNMKSAMVNQKDVDVIVTTGYDEQSEVVCSFTIKFSDIAKRGPKMLFQTVKQRMKNLGYKYEAYSLNLYEVK